MAGPPKMSLKNTHTPLHFYALPRDVAVRIFSFLPLHSLLICQRINKRFRNLITRSAQIRPHLFLEPPATSPPDAKTSVFLHPVFGRLNFFAYHSAKAIRIGEGLDGMFLVKCAVREQFATSPALPEVVIRVISGGKWPFDAEIAVINEKGVTVWDVVQEVTGFFNEYEQISFGDHFGVDVCAQHEWDPKALMQNHEFLNPDSPFPTIYIPDRECNKVFIADYAFNEFAAMPLVQRPAEWCTEENSETERANAEAEELAEGGGRNECEVEEGGLAEGKSGYLKKREGVDANAAGPLGSRDMELDNNSELKEFNSSRSIQSSSGSKDGFYPIRGAAGIARAIVPAKIEQTQAKLLDKTPSSLGINESASLETAMDDNAFQARKASKLLFGTNTSLAKGGNLEKFVDTAQTRPTEVPPNILNTLKGMPTNAPVKLNINTSINLNPRTTYTTPIKVPISRASEPVDWEDAFN